MNKTKEIMDKFFIDRQFGIQIWIDVENGIVLKCSCEKPKFIARMHELYKGKSISFLKKDFEKRMSGTYHKVWSDSVFTAIRQVDNFEMKLKHLWNRATSIKTSKEEKERCMKEISKTEKELYKSKKFLNSERERIQNEHKFKF